MTLLPPPQTGLSPNQGNSCGCWEKALGAKGLQNGSTFPTLMITSSAAKTVQANKLGAHRPLWLFHGQDLMRCLSAITD